MFRSRLRAVVVAGGLVAAAGVLTALVVTTHDQDVTVYSVRPDGRVQEIGLRHRTYLIECGGGNGFVVFRTTFSTGVLTHGSANTCPLEEVRTPPARRPGT